MSKESNIFNLSAVELFASAMMLVKQCDWHAFLEELLLMITNANEANVHTTRLLLHSYHPSIRMRDFREKLALKLIGSSDLDSALESFKIKWSSDYRNMIHLLSAVQILAINASISLERVLDLSKCLEVQRRLDSDDNLILAENQR